MCIFMNGLKKEVRAEMTVGEFRNLTAMMDRALELEQRNLAWVDAGVHPGMRGAGGPSRGPGPFRTQPSIRLNVGNTQGGGSKSDIGPDSFRTQNGVRGNSGGARGSGLSSSVNGPSESRTSGIRRLSHEDWQERQRKGLCFRCGDKWNPEHICQLRHHQFILMEEGVAGNLEDEDTGTPIEEELEAELKELQLSSFSYWGLTSNKSLKVWGEIQGEQVIVLVDSGASANFISTKVVEKLQLPIDRVKGFKVEVGNGAIEEGFGVCRGVELLVQGIRIVQNFFVLELGRPEVVLGVDWLAGLGNFVGNYKNMTLSWVEKGSRVLLRGDPTLCKSKSSWKAALKALRAEGKVI